MQPWCFIYKNYFNKDALKLFMSDIEKGLNLNDLLNSEHTRGQFCLIIYLNNKLTLISIVLVIIQFISIKSKKIFQFQIQCLPLH